jgi:hypothetical protein
VSVTHEKGELGGPFKWLLEDDGALTKLHYLVGRDDLVGRSGGEDSRGVEWGCDAFLPAWDEHQHVHQNKTKHGPLHAGGYACFEGHDGVGGDVPGTTAARRDAIGQKAKSRASTSRMRCVVGRFGARALTRECPAWEAKRGGSSARQAQVDSG